MDNTGSQELSTIRDLYDVLQRASGTSKLGLRDRHKVDKVRRISEATRLLLTRSGYEASTLREIAEVAGVALGTLACYAVDKRDLVLLLFNQEIPKLISAGRVAINPSNTALENLIGFLTPCYREYARSPALFRVLLRDNLFSLSSVHAREFHRLRLEMVEVIGEILRSAKKDEGFSFPNIDLAARSLFFMYFAAVRWWISAPSPKAKTGISELESLFQLQIDGFRASK